jgi:ATP-binding cassette subfamily D (ALD) protein 3
LLRFTNGIIDSVLVKYCATQLAFYILSRPVFGGIRQSGQEPTRAASDIMEEYSRNSGYLINLSQAVGRIVLAGRDLTRFAGYTSRVSDLMSVIEDVAAGRYQRTMFSSDTSDINNDKSDETTTKKGGAAVSEVRVIDCTRLGGVVEEQDGVIEFVDVPICTPSGDILVPSMSFRVVSGMNCLITGPNGCGKSSLFRILGGLWPQFGGHIVKPRQAQMFYVPQKPYLPQGTLRDQITYPSSPPATTPKEDDDLTDLLQTVHLGYLVEREGGWDAVHDWADVLSGGEKQRVAMARLFYHRPQFAILDECTSAVSIDVEGKMYTHAKALGITLFTVSHRPSLFPYHEYLLRFDGQGGYEFGQLVVLEGDAHHPFSFTTPKKAPQAMVSEGHDSFDGEEGDVEEEEGDLFYSRD